MIKENQAEEKRIHQICIDLCLSYDDPFMSCGNCQVLRQAEKANDCRRIYETKQ